MHACNKMLYGTIHYVRSVAVACQGMVACGDEIQWSVALPLPLNSLHAVLATQTSQHMH